MESLHGVGQDPCLEKSRCREEMGDVNDWHHAIGNRTVYSEGLHRR